MTTPSNSDRIDSKQRDDATVPTTTERQLRPDGGHETVDTDTRERILKRDGRRCKLCGRAGNCVGGPATLEVHHIRRDEDIDEHHPNNLLTLCQDCHHWHHQQETDELPVTLSEADEQELRPYDKQILVALDEQGPLTTGELATHLDVEKTANAVRDRCRLLMGLDEIVASRSEQLLDQDAETGKWGLTHQIDTSARGEIPDNTRTLLKRAEDEMVRQMREQGYSREEVGEVVGVTARTIRKKERSAKAYQFPLDLVAGSEARTDHRGRSEDAQSVTDTTGDTGAGEPVASDHGDPMTTESPVDEAPRTPSESDSVGDSDDLPPLGGLVTEAHETTASYLFVTFVNEAQDRLRGIRTAELNDQIRDQIAQAVEPLPHLAEAVRVTNPAPRVGGDGVVFELVDIASATDPDGLGEEE
jgi:5-methylcytosine-specific restriction endonuclease McrA